MQHILALKGNQGSLREDVEVFVAEQKAKGFSETTVTHSESIDGDHGRGNIIVAKPIDAYR